MGLAMQKWNLHRRIALMTLRAMGDKPKRQIAGFMLATAFLSMWVSNTATAIMMLPWSGMALRLPSDYPLNAATCFMPMAGLASACTA